VLFVDRPRGLRLFDALIGIRQCKVSLSRHKAVFCCVKYRFCVVNKCDKCSETKCSTELWKNVMYSAWILWNVFLKEITEQHRGWLETEDNTSC